MSSNDKVEITVYKSFESADSIGFKGKSNRQCNSWQYMVYRWDELKNTYCDLYGGWQDLEDWVVKDFSTEAYETSVRYVSPSRILEKLEEGKYKIKLRVNCTQCKNCEMATEADYVYSTVTETSWKYLYDYQYYDINDHPEDAKKPYEEGEAYYDTHLPELGTVTLLPSGDNTHAKLEFYGTHIGWWVLKNSSTLNNLGGQYFYAKKYEENDTGTEAQVLDGVEPCECYTLEFWRYSNETLGFTTNVTYAPIGANLFELNSEGELERVLAVPWVYHGKKWLLATPFVCKKDRNGNLEWKLCKHWNWG